MILDLRMPFNYPDEDIFRIHTGEDLALFVKSEMIQDSAKWKERAKERSIFLSKPKGEKWTFAVVDCNDEYLVNRSKCLGCGFDKGKFNSINRLKSFISSKIGLNSHIFEIATTPRGQKIQNLDQVQMSFTSRKPITIGSGIGDLSCVVF